MFFQHQEKRTLTWLASLMCVDYTGFEHPVRDVPQTLQTNSGLVRNTDNFATPSLTGYSRPSKSASGHRCQPAHRRMNVPSHGGNRVLEWSKGCREFLSSISPEWEALDSALTLGSFNRNIGWFLEASFNLLALQVPLLHRMLKTRRLGHSLTCLGTRPGTLVVSTVCTSVLST